MCNSCYIKLYKNKNVTIQEAKLICWKNDHSFSQSELKITALPISIYLSISVSLFYYKVFPTMLFYVNLVWPMIGQPKQAKRLLGFTDTLGGKDLMEVNTLPRTIS